MALPGRNTKNGYGEFPCHIAQHCVKDSRLLMSSLRCLHRMTKVKLGVCIRLNTLHHIPVGCSTRRAYKTVLTGAACADILLDAIALPGGNVSEHTDVTHAHFIFNMDGMSHQEWCDVNTHCAIIPSDCESQEDSNATDEPGTTHQLYGGDCPTCYIPRAMLILLPERTGMDLVRQSLPARKFSWWIIPIIRRDHVTGVIFRIFGHLLGYVSLSRHTAFSIITRVSMRTELMIRASYGGLHGE
jgi:hypothetical protein